MNVVIWARVSSREQREGYSIDAQLRATREMAERNGWQIVRVFEVAESARRGAERQVFNQMLKWVRGNAKKLKLKAILSHKLDRACRNMQDAVKLQELEDRCGVKLEFVENQFAPGAAGALSFNVMAAVAQYYSDNLRSEVLKGMDEKVRQGWPTGLAPFGYVNVQDCPDEPVQPHPTNARTLVRIFELFSTGSYTFKSLTDQLEREGHVFRATQKRFNRTALSHILKNRFYIGELRRNGHVYEGRYQRLIDRTTFDACQGVLQGRNRRTGTPNMPYSGGLFRCAYCGQSITGERIRRKLKNGGVNEHEYYRCANNAPGPDHPKVRWRAEDLEQAVMDDLESLRLPSDEIASWFRTALSAAVSDITAHQKRQATAFGKRKAELTNMQNRLLNAYLGGMVDEAAYVAKSNELKGELARLDENATQTNVGVVDADLAVRLFDWTQNVAQIWRGSNTAARREILDSICLNRTLGDLNLVTEKRKPFDVFAERPKIENSRGDRI